MIKKRLTASRGFTLTELIIAMAIMLIVILAIGMALVDGQRSWNIQYDRIYSDVITDGYVARRKFDAVMRTASRDNFWLDDTGSWVEVYYYADDTSTVVDRYARFYVANGDLNVEYGQLNPKVTLTIETVCGNVSGCTFAQVGRSIQMILTLDNGTRTNTVISSAVTHN
ncbi:MAG: prepilin-type N-terminal cleavage/methylation domain-containing protein [Planctomycetes bacterium]|nr:prepilin-type N-terminal cleavage/methylation domain-containing protein [Planctomycetota bacterium]MCH8119965.1 prepilin-type N-terminal cleavage/methylation domain-containing protein [Planctomycetota bacterium]